MRSLNIKFPLQDDVVKNRAFLMNSVTKEALTSNLLLLLLTKKGERYYEPDYGVNIRKYLFEPKDGVTQSDIEEEIRQTVKLFIPQLTISSVKFFSDTDDVGDDLGDNQINILVEFKYSEDVFSETGSITLTI